MARRSKMKSSYRFAFKATRNASSEYILPLLAEIAFCCELSLHRQNRSNLSQAGLNRIRHVQSMFRLLSKLKHIRVWVLTRYKLLKFV